MNDSFLVKQHFALLGVMAVIWQLFLWLWNKLRPGKTHKLQVSKILWKVSIMDEVRNKLMV